jgi:hypothetical protein
VLAVAVPGVEKSIENDSFRSNETFEKYSLLFKFKEGSPAAAG